jgi:hypothetical protein
MELHDLLGRPCGVEKGLSVERSLSPGYHRRGMLHRPDEAVLGT